LSEQLSISMHLWYQLCETSAKAQLNDMGARPHLTQMRDRYPECNDDTQHFARPQNLRFYSADIRESAAVSDKQWGAASLFDNILVFLLRALETPIFVIIMDVGSPTVVGRWLLVVQH